MEGEIKIKQIQKEEGEPNSIHNWHFPPCKRNSFNLMQHEKFHNFSGSIVKTKVCFPEMISKSRPE